MTGIEHHLFFFDDIKEFKDKQEGARPHSSIQRGLCSYTFFDKESKTHATITNMMGIILFTLYNKGEDEYWENTEIINEEGIIKAENQAFQSVCAGELTSIMNGASDKNSLLSKNQENKIRERMTKDKSGFKRSKSYESLKKDFEL